jgi:hypothetical protein
MTWVRLRSPAAVKSPTDERRFRERNAGRRERNKRRYRALRMAAQRALLRLWNLCACARKETWRRCAACSAARILCPTPKRFEASKRGFANVGQWTDALPNLTLGSAKKRPQRQCEADRTCRIQAPRQYFPRHHKHACTATLAFVPAGSNAEQHRSAVCRQRTAQLARPCPVAVKGQRLPRWLACSPASGALPRPNLRYRGNFLHPRLDLNLTSVDLCTALHLCQSSIGRCSSKLAFRSPFKASNNAELCLRNAQ